MSKVYEVRDPVHGRVEFDDFERRVIDHPYVQRLRHIRQLGFVSLVFPGGTHERFSHSLGVMHVAGSLFDRIEKRSEQFRELFSSADRKYLRQVVRLAGLLHDVGHPPFSHSSECLLPELKLLELPKHWFVKVPKERRSRHEDFTLWVINVLAGERIGISKEMAQDIASLIHWGVVPAGKGKNFRQRNGWNCHGLLRALISGECDADRMDYLLRDSLHCGVAYGNFDIDRLIYSMKPFFNSDKKEIYFSLEANGIFSFEDFLLARYHMFLQIYLHKTVLCFDHFLLRAYEEKELPFPRLLKPERMMDLTDNDVWIWARDAARDPKNVWSQRLTLRKPARRLIQLSPFDTDREDFRALAERLQRALQRKKIPHFMVETGPYLTMIGRTGSPPFYVDRPAIHGKNRFVPMERFSRLIERYNERVQAVHVYVWHEDMERARKVVGPMMDHG